METIISEFYTAFQNLDAESMVKHYHQNVIFEDPAFGVLKGERAKNMWRMLCESQKGKNFMIEFSQIESTETKGEAHWEAWDTFSKTGRKVHNIIDASFEFKDGKIIKHTDTFNLFRWSRQAMGIAGLILGWTPLFKKKLHAQTNKMLSVFIRKRAS